MYEYTGPLFGLPTPSSVRMPYNVRSVVVVTPPAGEPVTVDLARKQLRLISTDDDELLALQIAAARVIVEAAANRALVRQTWRVTYDRFETPLRLPGGDVAAVHSVTYLDSDGVRQTLDPALYAADAESVPGRVAHAPHKPWPCTQAVPGAVSVTYDVGAEPAMVGNPPEPDYGANVHPALRAAVLMLVADLYENSESTMTTGVAIENPAFDRLISLAKVVTI